LAFIDSFWQLLLHKSTHHSMGHQHYHSHHHHLQLHINLTDCQQSGSQTHLHSLVHLYHFVANLLLLYLDYLPRGEQWNEQRVQMK